MKLLHKWLKGSIRHALHVEGTRVILVEGDAIFAEVLETAFTSKGFDITTLPSGTKALEFFKAHRKKLDETVTIVLVARLLPDMDGFKVLEKVINQYGHRIPVVVLSHLTSENDIIDALRLGAIDHISKPINIKTLIEQVESLASWWKALREGK